MHYTPMFQGTKPVLFWGSIKREIEQYFWDFFRLCTSTTFYQDVTLSLKGISAACMKFY